jgi:hypothetical protein
MQSYFFVKVFAGPVCDIFENEFSRAEVTMSRGAIRPLLVGSLFYKISVTASRSYQDDMQTS